MSLPLGFQKRSMALQYSNKTETRIERLEVLNGEPFEPCLRRDFTANVHSECDRTYQKFYYASDLKEQAWATCPFLTSIHSPDTPKVFKK